MAIIPQPGRILVKLPVSEFGHIPVTPKPHDSLTHGVGLALDESDVEQYGHFIGRTLFWRLYKDDARITKELCLIDLTDIMGYDDASTGSPD